MKSKQEQLADLMADVAGCKLCCEVGHGVKPNKLLHNFINERPDGPRYGGVPNLWTDWANRLHAKIVMVAQDWGAEGGKEGTTLWRKKYEISVEQFGSPDETWRQQMRQRLGLDRNRMVAFFLESARREGLPALPNNFMDDLYLTNSVLCVRRGEQFSGDVERHALWEQAIVTRVTIHGSGSTPRFYVRMELSPEWMKKRGLWLSD